MANSSEKVPFRVDMQCSSLRAEAFLVFDKGSQPTLGQQISDSRPTNGQQSADYRQKIFIEGGKRQLADCRSTVVRLSVDCRLTVGQQSADSFLGELFFIFSLNSVLWTPSRLNELLEVCFGFPFTLIGYCQSMDQS